MIATIAPVSGSGSVVDFDLKKNPFYTGEKRVSKQKTLAQTAVIYDFGFCAADSDITLTDCEVTKPKAARLIAMQQSTTETDFWFSNGFTVYKVKIARVSVRPHGYGKYLADITLTTVEKIV